MPSSKALTGAALRRWQPHHRIGLATRADTSAGGVDDSAGLGGSSRKPTTVAAPFGRGLLRSWSALPPIWKTPMLNVVRAGHQPLNCRGLGQHRQCNPYARELHVEPAQAGSFGTGVRVVPGSPSWTRTNTPRFVDFTIPDIRHLGWVSRRAPEPSAGKTSGQCFLGKRCTRARLVVKR